MKARRLFLAILAAAALMASCDKPEVPEDPTLELSQNSITVNAAGGSVDITVTANNDWNCESNADWLSLKKEGDKLTVSIEENVAEAGSAAAERNAKITVTAASLTAEISVNQGAEDIVFKVLNDPNPASFTKAGGVLKVSVETNVLYGVQIADGCDWITNVTTKAVATDNLSFEIAKNTGAERSSTITISNGSNPTTITVSQEKGALPLVMKTAEEFAEFIAASPELPEGETYSLGADIDLSGVTLAVYPKTDTIRCNLDGAGWAIKNWTTSDPLFRITTGSVKNLKIDASCKLAWEGELAEERCFAFIVGDNLGKVSGCSNYGSIVIKNSGAQKIFVAGIAARQETLPMGVVANCANYGDINIEASKSASVSGIGGVVARIGNVEFQDKCQVEDCYNEGNIVFLFNGETTAMKKFGVGGVVGLTRTVAGSATKETPNHGIVRRCINKGNIKWTYTEGGSGSYPALGGVIGAIEGELYDCSNYGSVCFECGSATTATTDASIGGVAGYVTYNAENCHNYGEVDAKGSIAGGTRYAQGGGNIDYSCFGGVFGAAGPYVECKAGEENPVTIKNCTNNYELSMHPSMSQSGGPLFCCGGVVGCISANMVDCVNNKNVTFTSNARTLYAGGVAGIGIGSRLVNCKNLGNVVADGDGDCPSTTAKQVLAAGIMAYTYNAGCTFNKCENKGNITIQNVDPKAILGGSEGAWTAAAYQYAGGILGTYKSSGNVLTDCVNTGDITNNCDICMVMGGIAAAVNGTVTGSTTSGKITNNATTFVTGKPTEIGGFIGYINGTIDNCSTESEIVNTCPGGYIGGFASGLDKTVLTWTGNIMATKSVSKGPDDVLVGSLVGRARTAGTTYSLTWKNGQISGPLAEMPYIGFDQGTVVNIVNE